ncbi:MAG TPA: hypothetical protein VFP84_27985 [Kofleriaceae bacterium]|nr:hypothetical protein [Kofleriaceae bacterium]
MIVLPSLKRAGALALIAAAGVARGAPLARQRVVLADADVELRHAVEHALAPWRLTVVIEGPPPADSAAAQLRADRDTARFVVWRAGDELVVYDRELGTTERRASRAGPLDPPTAAAAALTIKTMMRLPPPVVVDAAAPEIHDEAAPAPAPEAAPWLRVTAGALARIAHGNTTSVAPRVVAAIAAHPWRDAWWIGVAGDFGPALTVDNAGFTGTWSEVALRAELGRAFAIAAWELEPQLAIGLRHSGLDGTDKGSPRTESATLADTRLGVWVRWRWRGWTVGGVAALGVTFGAPTYIKTGAAAEIFQVPGTAHELGALVAKDL